MNKRITILEKHTRRKAMRDAQDIRRILSNNGVYFYKMTPEIRLRPHGIINHLFTKGDDTE